MEIELSEKQEDDIVRKVISKLLEMPEYDYEAERIKWKNADLSE